MRTTVTALVLALALSLLASPAHAEGDLLTGGGQGYFGIAMDDAGRYLATTRRFYVSTGLCSYSSNGGVALVDLRPDCGWSAVTDLHPLSSAPVANLSFGGAALSRDGSTLGYITDQVPSVITVAPIATLSSASSTPADSDSTAVYKSLNLSADGSTLFWLRVTGSTVSLMRRSGTTTQTLDTATSGASDMRLNPQHAVSGTGTVYYTKRDSGASNPNFHVFKVASGSTTVVQVTSSSNYEEELVSVSDSGTAVYTRDNEVAHTSNLVLEGGTVLLASSIAENDIIALDISGDASHVAFVATGAFPGGMEAWRVKVSTGTVTQVTANASLGDVLGVSISADASQVAYSRSKGYLQACPSVADLNIARVQIVTFPGVTLNADLGAIGFPTPPFDLVTSATGVTPAPGCTFDSGTNDVVCHVLLRNGTDGTRRFLVGGQFSRTAVPSAVIEHAQLQERTLASDRMTIHTFRTHLPISYQGTVTFDARAITTGDPQLEQALASASVTMP